MASYVLCGQIIKIHILTFTHCTLRLLSAADNITLDAVNVDLVCNSDDLSDLKKGVREHAPLI